MEQTTSVLEIKGLTKSLGGRRILSNINLSLKPGEVFGFLGPNGSGKTTTIKLILGLLNIEEGEIKICGHDVQKDFESAIVNVGGIIENPEMYKYLTGRENLVQYMRMYDGIDPKRIDEVVKTVHLEGRINDKISKYSLGMKQRLGIAQAILHEPRLLVLDEPTNGLDPAGIKELRDIFKTLAHEKNCTVFVSSHMLAELELMCDRVCVIDRGAVIKTMTMEDIHSTDAEDTVRYSIQTSNDAKCREILGKLEIQCEESAEVYVNVPKTKIAEAVRSLVSEGVDIYALIPETKSLEDAFMEITKSETGGVGL